MHPQEVPEDRLSKCLHQDWNGYVPSSRYEDPGGFGKFNSALPKYSQSAHIRFLAFTDKKFRSDLDELQKPDVDFAAIPSRKTTVFIHTRRREQIIDATTPDRNWNPVPVLPQGRLYSARVSSPTLTFSVLYHRHIQSVIYNIK